MLKIENTETYGWSAAIRGMRNPLNSWDKSDTQFFPGVVPSIGPNDFKLMKKLGTAGNDHGKFLRMIGVSADVIGPMYWWAEADTYKIGTVRNSCSKMHKIHSKPIELSDFSMDDFVIECGDMSEEFSECFRRIVADCETLRLKYLETGDKAYGRGLIQLLPASYNQRSTLTLNYAVLKNIYHAHFCFFC